MTTTYAKLKSGAWGVRMQGAAQSGQTITVNKRDGGTKTEVIDKVLWTDGKVSLCSIARVGGVTKTCWECGCEFTYAECRRSGGDWSDSYCGC